MGKADGFNTERYFFFLHQKHVVFNLTNFLFLHTPDQIFVVVTNTQYQYPGK